MDAEEKTRKLSELDHTRIKGAHAHALMQSMEPIFESVRQEYVRQLVKNTKTNGEPHALSAYRLVALDDIEALLKLRISEAAAAAKRMDRITARGGD